MSVCTLWFIYFCLLFRVGKQCAVAFRRLLQLAVKWRLAGCSNNKVDLTRWLRAEETHVPCSSHATDLSKVLSFRASVAFYFFYLAFFFFVSRSRAHVVPSFRLSLGRNSGHAMCQLGNRGTVVQFSQPIWGHVPALPYASVLWFKKSRESGKLEIWREGLFFLSLFLQSHLTGGNHSTRLNLKKRLTPLTVRHLDWNLLLPAG